MKKLVVVFDLCDTFVEGNTTFIFLDHFLKNNSSYKLYRKISRFFLLKIVFKILSFIQIDVNRKIALLFLRGVKKEILLNNVNYLVRNNFAYEEDIIKLIKLFNQNNIPVYIVSASLDIIVKAVADKFNVNYISSKLGYKDNICTGLLEQDLLYKKHAFFTKNSKYYSGIEFEHLLFVSDNVQDISIIKRARLGFGFYTNKNVRKFTINKIDEFEINKIISSIITYDKSIFNHEKKQ